MLHYINAFIIIILLYLITVDSTNINLCDKACKHQIECVKKCLKYVQNVRKSIEINPSIKHYSGNKNYKKPLYRNINSNQTKNFNDERAAPQFKWPVVSPYCGLKSFKQKSSIKMRVVGGISAENHEFPWIVSIRDRGKNGNFKHSCGGTLLNDYFILTAAHCVDKIPKSINLKEMLTISLGSNYLNDGTTMTVSDIIVHNRWDRARNLNDIALIRTTRPIRFEYDKQSDKYTVNGICLPPKDAEPKGSAILSGWGQTGENEPTSAKLLKVELPKYKKEECVRNYRKYAVINENTICYGGEGGKDSCMGDSGGPLIQLINGRAVLIGIVSFGIPCAIKGYPGIYTQVSKYIDWITQNANI